MRENDQTLWGGEEGGGEAEQISPEILITFSLQHGHGHEVVCLLASSVLTTRALCPP